MEKKHKTFQLRNFHLIFQLGMITWQCNDTVKDKYQEKEPIEFYKCLLRHKYGHLKSYATSVCEKPFSKMKPLKFRFRSALTDEHLQSIFVMEKTNFEPQLNEILLK